MVTCFVLSVVGKRQVLGFQRYGFAVVTIIRSCLKLKTDTLCTSPVFNESAESLAKGHALTPLQKYTFFNIRKKKCVVFMV